MKSHEFITEGPESSDYQQMLNFVNNNKTPGVPPEQQVALAMFRELNKQQAQNKQLGAELKAAEQRIDIAAQGGELASAELGKHQGELERERGDIDKQRDKMGKIDQKNSEREKASAEQLQNLTAQLDQIKQKPGVDPNATKELEKQMDELKKNGLDADKYQDLEQAVANMQNMQQVDDKTMQSLIGQVKDAQAKADELSQTRAAVGGEIEQSTAGMQDEIEKLKAQLAHFREVEQTVAALQPMVQDVLAPKVDKLIKNQDIADKVNRIKTTQAFARDEITRNAARSALQPQAPAPDPQMSLPGVAESKLLKAIKWATGK
jgi:DNA repair exonuclease SbcCD ATPase subunit